MSPFSQALALPVLAGWLPLWVAVTLHEGSTLLVALNSLRLLSWPADAARGRTGSGAAGADAASRMAKQQPGEQGQAQRGGEQQQLAVAAQAA